MCAMVPADFAKEFYAQCDQRNYKKKAAMYAAYRLWKELPAEIQARLYSEEFSGNAFIDLVNYILASDFRRGTSAPEPPTHKPVRGR